MNIQPTTYTSQLPKLLTNGQRLATNYAHYLSQNSSTLKTNALVISSLILVLSRIAIAQGSAKKAAGTPEGPFRYREAIRTTIREAAGWTLSFMVLRSFEFAVKKGLVNYFKINFVPAVQNAAHSAEEALKASTEQFIQKHELSATGLFKSIGTFGKNLVDFIRNKPFESVVAKKGAYYGSQFFQFNSPERFKQWEGLINLFSSNKNAPAVDRLKNFYQWFPLLMGSIPAITLSGYALEKFNMNHSQALIDAIAKQKENKANRSGGASPPPTPSSFNKEMGWTASMPNQTNQRFLGYMDRVYQEKLQRGLS